MTRCFWLEPTGRLRRSLRVFTWSATNECAARSGGYCEAKVAIDEVAIAWGAADDDGEPRIENHYRPELFAGDARWPSKCAHCGREFRLGDLFLSPGAERQVFTERIYRRADSGAELVLREAPPGAMWDSWWYPRKGADRRSLCVRCPDGQDWLIDARASNCTMPEDDAHRCWIRHGAPPAITVDKNGHTCGAGGGSIDTGTWHGWLREGVLSPC